LAPDRFRLLCYLCRQPYGGCIQCNATKGCRASFHVLCAANAGFHLAMREATAGAGGGLEAVNFCRAHTTRHHADGAVGGVELVAWQSPSAAAAKKRHRCASHGLLYVFPLLMTPFVILGVFLGYTRFHVYLATHCFMFHFGYALLRCFHLKKLINFAV
jgi:hypothetical protein